MNSAAAIVHEAESRLRAYKKLEGKTYAPPHLRKWQAELEDELGKFLDDHECPTDPIDYSRCNLEFGAWPADECDWRAAMTSLFAPPGRVWMETGARPEYRGVIALNDELSANSRPDCGTVLSAGPDSGLYAGQVIAVVPMDGTDRIDFTAGAYAAKPGRHVFSYGVYCDDSHRGDPVLYPLEFSILAIIEQLDHRSQVDAPYALVVGDLAMRPYRSNILVRQDPVMTKDRGVILPDSEHFRGNVGTVVAVGPDCSFAKVGMRVVYHPNACKTFDRKGFDPDIACMLECGIEAVLAA